MNFMLPRFGGIGGGIQRPIARPQMPFGGGYGVMQGANPSAMMGYQPQMGVPLSGLRTAQMPSYKNGIPYVPRTGPAVLHEGEMVVPAPKAKKMRKVALSSLLRLK